MTRADVGATLLGLGGLDESTVDKIVGVARILTLDAKSYVFRIGDSCEAFVVVLSGAIRVRLLSAAGREVTLYRISPGDSCLLTTSCLFSHERYPAEAITESTVTALAVPMRDFEGLLAESSAFRAYVFNGFAARLTDVIGRIEAVALTPVDTRLAAVLLKLHDSGLAEVTHQELAVELGTAREVVSRHLKRFEKDGLLDLGRGHITVIEPIALRRIADDSAV